MIPCLEFRATGNYNNLTNENIVTNTKKRINNNTKKLIIIL